MDSAKLNTFLTERGLLGRLCDFEAYYSSPASSEQPNPVSDPEMEVEFDPSRESIKRESLKLGTGASALHACALCTSAFDLHGRAR
ncbi:hypothetical protein EVAR_60309_1 [Eumeta japonica]|uniref:Uncharacterized protein n=1 Tax=Eumeta variegata TaxID=151549 RepID=A0A4C1Z953_EUMVA|nr:hypothetical protein EVAR_60309_1 [Eumeta japonica]